MNAITVTGYIPSRKDKTYEMCASLHNKTKKLLPTTKTKQNKTEKQKQN